MKFPSTILAIFNKHAGMQAAGDGIISVPNVLTPTIELPSRMQLLGNGAGFPSQSQSFALDYTQASLNAAGAISASLVFLAPGLWEIIAMLAYISDDTSTTKTGRFFIREQASALTVCLASWVPIGATNQFIDFYRWRLSLATQHELFIDGSNTAAAKTTLMNGSLVVNRLG